ncbi:MAG: hypothetical protein ABII82_02170 [Verrucomicrobiota bacterium]
MSMVRLDGESGDAERAVLDEVQEELVRVRRAVSDLDLAWFGLELACSDALDFYKLNPDAPGKPRLERVLGLILPRRMGEASVRACVQAFVEEGERARRGGAQDEGFRSWERPDKE